LSKKLFSLAILFAGLLAINSINFIGCGTDNPIVPGETVSFSRDVLPIFAANCTFPGCHNSTDKQSGLDFTSWESIMKGSLFGTEIIPYNSKWSHTIKHINRVDTNISSYSEPLMPQAKVPFTNGQPLPRNLIETIVNWINQGAKNDTAKLHFLT
jgi:hypothetical protein